HHPDLHPSPTRRSSDLGPRRRTAGGLLDEALMRAAATDEQLRTALFRFVDVRPACRTRSELGEHLAALLGEAEPASARARLASRSEEHTSELQSPCNLV